MSFTQKNLSTLEYDKIISMLAQHATTDGSRARALSLLPSSDIDTVMARQEKTFDAKRLINAKGFPAFSAPAGGVPQHFSIISILINFFPPRLTRYLRE